MATSPYSPPEPPKDRLTVRFPGVHIEGVGRGVSRVLMALVIVGGVMLVGLVIGRLL